MQYVTMKKRNLEATTESEDSHERLLGDKSNATGFIPMLPMHNDTILFLKGQAEMILHKSLPQLVDSHEKYIKSGNNLLDVTRKEIIRMLGELSRTYDALGEIYQSEKKSKLEKYDMFLVWIKRKHDINQDINEIIDSSPEGETYSSLLKESKELSYEIDRMERELLHLRKKRKLVNQQLLETKSLLDIKLNKHYNELETLEQKEVSLKKLKTQITSLDTLISKTADTQLMFDQAEAYFTDIFEVIKKMENSIQTFINESKLDNIGHVLSTNRDYLIERYAAIVKIEMPGIAIIMKNEIKAIEKAMSILNINFVAYNFDSSSKDFALSQLKLSEDSTEYYPSIPASNTPPSDSNKRFNSTSKSKTLAGSPPPVITAATTTTTTTTATTTAASKPSKSNLNIMGFKSAKVNKYNQLLNEIKSSKGEKTD
ncbi:hypothetical protein JL09_g1569 [Pichia kudriavzevii]|uniref:Uncharacterized protein n=1 Tax=Pichia kudriavzevii TaxID=4909 RepID=A0A099P4V4_PICKU|nr:hypothetical protein JL09_g1569 [Pichia kudriavzevii]